MRTHRYQLCGLLVAFAASQDGDTLWVSSTCRLHTDRSCITEWRDGAAVWHLQVGCPVQYLAVGLDGTLWSASVASCKVKGWRNKKCVVTLDTMGPVQDLAVGWDGSICVTGQSNTGNSSYLMEWNVVRDEPRRAWKLVGQFRQPNRWCVQCLYSGDGVLWIADINNWLLWSVTAWVPS